MWVGKKPPPFSSKPINAFLSMMVLETSTLPTLVRITFADRLFATSSITCDELTGVTIVELGFLSRR